MAFSDKTNYRFAFIRDNLSVAAGNLLIALRGIILLPILIKSVGIEVYGQYTLLVITITFLFMISNLGVGFKFKRYMPSAEALEEKQKLFYTQFFFSVTVALVVSFFLFFAFYFFEQGHFPLLGTNIFPVCVILVLKSARNKLTEYFRFTNRARSYIVIHTLSNYFEVAAIAVAVFFLSRVELGFLLWALAASMFVMVVPLYFRIFSEIGFKLVKVEWHELKEDIRLGFPLVLSNISDFVLSSSDRYVIAFYMSATAVGFYNPAYTLGTFILLAPKVTSIVLPPLLSRLEDGGAQDEGKKILNTTIKMYLLIAIPFIVGATAIARPLLELLATKEVGRTAAFITPMVALGLAFYGLNLIISNFLFIKLKTKLIFGINVFAAGLNFVLNIVFIFFIRNILMAAVTTFFSYFIAYVVLHFRVRSLIRIHYSARTISRSLLASLVMFLFMRTCVFWLPGLGAGVCVAIALGCLSYFIMLFVLGVFDEREISAFKGFLSQCGSAKPYR